MDMNRSSCWTECRSSLVHVEITFQNAFLHGIGNLGLLGHLPERRFHDGDTLGAMMGRGLWAVHWVCTRHGRTLGARAEVLCEIVSLACIGKYSRQLEFSDSLIWMTLEMLGKNARKIRMGVRGTLRMQRRSSGGREEDRRDEGKRGRG